VNACIEQSIANGYQGIFAIEKDGTGIQRKRGSKLFVPSDDNKLWKWATANGFPDPGRSETNKAYRQRLQHLARQRKAT